MTVAARLERTYRVRFDEAGPDGFLRASGFVRYAQDMAWIHSESAGFGRAWYRDRGLFWLVRGVELDLLEDVDYGTELVVSTEVIGFRRVIARRRSEFHLPESERPVATVLTDWVLLKDNGRPVQPPAEILEMFPPASNEFAPLRARVGEPPAHADEAAFSVRRSEADPMGHVNNAVYVDYLDEGFLRRAARDGGLPVPRRYRVEFAGSALPGSRVTARGWDEQLAWSCTLTDENGHETLRATLETDSAAWVGG
ncbi:MAG TPA: acyl-ACP thioesterase domain-containing protein [Candidatus Limnocylindrales bacterium]|nr:acyl-ACP thioesterase domain-containing protein [Candidatus Limnocylindrales bacterium]